MNRAATMLRSFIVVLFLAAAAAAERLNSRSDLAGLYGLRGSLGLRSRDWPRRSDPCTNWTGVGCVAGRVVSLDLSGLRRTRLGKRNPRFAVDGLQNLTRLSKFNSTGFTLNGPIPDWFGNSLPSSLTVLDLSAAEVTGTIPFSLGGAAGLVVLSLARNGITGDIPETLGKLGNLIVLDLAENQLSGSIPGSLAELRNLSRLDLSTNFLTGVLPFGLGLLTRLERLILANNSLSGSVPSQIGNLSSLVVLDLSFNSLVGVIPDDLKRLSGLQDLNVSNNLLSGNLSDGIFAGMSRIRSIRLGKNNFSGSIPDSVWSLQDLRILDVSFNNLTGTLPHITVAGANVSGNGMVLDLSNNFYFGLIPPSFELFSNRFSFVDISNNYFDGTIPFDRESKNVNFEFNCFTNVINRRSQDDCEKFYDTRGLANVTAPTPSPSPSHKKGNRELMYILIGALGGTLVLGILILLIICCFVTCGRQTSEQREVTSTAIASGTSAQPSASHLSAVGQGFSYEQLVRATADFSDANLIKHGRSGDIFRGTLENGIQIVIKKMDVKQGKKECYAAELDLFSRGLHERLVPFLGHCLDKDSEKFLVYKYVPNGDLFTALQRKPESEEDGLHTLDWIKRLKIATGVAEALCYLHHECTPPLVHRDVQATSILLDDKFDVRLGSLSDVCVQEGEGHQNVITRLLRRSQTSEQGVSGPPATSAHDIYSLGKVLLELVTGKVGISASTDAATNEWLDHALPYINIYEKELITKIVDPFLCVDEDHLEEVWAVAIVAKSCLNPKSSRRPPMRHILKALENPLKVVREDNHSGSGRLRATSSRGSWSAAFMGSWRQSSDIVSVPGQSRDDQTLKRSSTVTSQGSGEHSFSRRKPSKEIFPEPSGAREAED